MNDNPRWIARQILAELRDWSERSDRKPLVLRGARQVGKSTLVRMLAADRGLDLVEVNFEGRVELDRELASRDPRRILRSLELARDIEIDPRRSLLFLDEIQAAPAALPALRYFYETMPELRVIAAGSLLDLALGEPGASVPVGRIEFLHVGPLTFEEFVAARGQSSLADWLRAYRFGDDVPGPAHARCLELLREYFVVGGMPKSVQCAVEGASLKRSEAERLDLLQAFEDDFRRYGPGANVARLQKVFRRLPQVLASRLKYTALDREERARDLARALDQLCQARVAHRVLHTSCWGVPLGATADEKRFKVLFLDVGLVSTACGLSIPVFDEAHDLVQINQGALAEQFVGQQLLHGGHGARPPELHCWMRESLNASAEVDFVIAAEDRVVPIEVKAGKSGRLRSLHVFAEEIGGPLALRLDSNLPSEQEVVGVAGTGARPRFRLVSLPLYLAGQVRRLARELVAA